MLKVDLNLHSKFSDKPDAWILRRIGMRQSYSEPEALYRCLHEAGMTYKTLTDHDSIEGCKALLHYPDVFLSQTITTFFPDGCKVHVLAWNITEVQHGQIQKIRRNIFDLSAYLRHEEIPHAVSQALVNCNHPLTVEHFEKLLLLFKIFEGRNGLREPLAQQTLEFVLGSLTPQTIEALAAKYNLAPTHSDPHKKILTAGSEDYAGLQPARAYTQTERGQSIREFFKELESGNVQIQGAYGDPLQLSTSLYSAIFHFVQTKLQKNSPLAASLTQSMADRFLNGQNPAAFSWGERVGLVTQALKTGQAFDFVKPGESSLAKEVGRFFAESKTRAALDGIIAEEKQVHRRTFRMTSYLANQLSYRLAQQFLKRLSKNNFLDAVQALSGFLPIIGAILPYLVSFRQQAPDRKLLAACSSRVAGKIPLFLQNTKRVWFTDTLEDVNGVARTIRAMTLAAHNNGGDLTVVTSRSVVTIDDIPIQNFTPVGEFEIPEYELQKLSFPPLLEILDYVQREGFTEIIISTPGPIGLCALACGHLLNLPMSGIYHTDFPQYARFLSDDSFIESLVWNYMHWFYAQMDTIYVNSEYYRRCWIDRGFPAEKFRILPRGLDTELFNPKHRQDDYWPKHGAKGPVVLYVGRISKEKELAFLADVFAALEKKGARFTPVFVGEGPYRAELQARLPKAVFTGILTGRELGIAYASADLFVFPSTTDTFGNVVIEAMAAGLPVIVSDVGGPSELVRSHNQGVALPARELEIWTQTIQSALDKPRSLAEREHFARQVRDERSWDRAFIHFWNKN